MSGYRLDEGGLIDRSRRLNFSFDGRSLAGHPGDTLASALLANGVWLLGRSFKYHRPRGIWGAGAEEPNAFLDLRLGRRQIAHCLATATELEEGMMARSLGGWPGRRLDLLAGLDRLHPYLGAGFYHKTFFRPGWRFWEPAIRRLAGRGRIDLAGAEQYRSAPIHDRAGLLVVGAGLAGLAAARAAAEAGEDVLVVDEQHLPGGGLHALGRAPDGTGARQWIAAQIAAIEAAGGRVLSATTALGVHDHNLVSLLRARGLAVPPRLIELRARRILLATGAIERPLLIGGNDRPGVMSAWAALEYLARYGVLVGRDMVLLSGNALAEAGAETLRAAGARILVLDPGSDPVEVLGRRRVRGLRIGAKQVSCDTVLVSGGYSPNLALWCQGGGGLDWDQEAEAFLPGSGPGTLAVAGAAAGFFDPARALEHAQILGRRLSDPDPPSGSLPAPSPAADIGLKRLRPAGAGRRWVDLAADVTVAELEEAAAEGYDTVEHLKRYTALGMSADQGRSSNVTGLELLARQAQRPVPEIGTTRFRPPYRPVPLASLAGVQEGRLLAPPKRMALEPVHRDAGGALREYGGWLRPGWYEKRPAEAIPEEVRAVREGVGLIDVSPLGKIEVMGPGAARFLDFVCYASIGDLGVGQGRYSFLLREDGSILDDGVVFRLGPRHFLLTCSSAHAGAVLAHLETWRQDVQDPDKVFLHDTTGRWQSLCVSGPGAREMLAALLPNIDLGAAGLAHMGINRGRFDGAPARVARLSFTGETSFEVSLPATPARALWRLAIIKGARPVGMEALDILRAEKGHVLVGRDTDSETMPPDLGFAAWLRKKPSPYLGDRGLVSEAARSRDRRQLVGLRVPEGAAPLPVGAHLVAGRQPRSQGFVTTSCLSPALGRPVALALLERGRARLGESVTVWHLGKTRGAVVAPHCAYDPKGERLDAK